MRRWHKPPNTSRRRGEASAQADSVAGAARSAARGAALQGAWAAAQLPGAAARTAMGGGSMRDGGDVCGTWGGRGEGEGCVRVQPAILSATRRLEAFRVQEVHAWTTHGARIWLQIRTVTMYSAAIRNRCTRLRCLEALHSGGREVRRGSGELCCWVKGAEGD